MPIKNTAVTIKCPHCGQQIEITDALAHDMRERVLQEELPKFQAREKAIADKEQEIARRETDVDSLVLARLAEEKNKLLPQLREEAKKESLTELSELRSQLSTKSQELSDVKQRELSLLKDKNQLDEDRANLDLTVLRKLNEEREGIRRQVAETFQEAHNLDNLKKEQQITDLRNTIETLKRQADQGSQQSQGEALENEIEEILRASFPMDTTEANPFETQQVKYVVSSCGRANLHKIGKKDGSPNSIKTVEMLKRMSV